MDGTVAVTAVAVAVAVIVIVAWCLWLSIVMILLADK
jgi:hypothetical protein